MLFRSFVTSISHKQRAPSLSKIRVTKGPASGYFVISKTGSHSYSGIATSLKTGDNHSFQNLPCSIISPFPLDEQTLYHLHGIISKSSCPITFRVSKIQDQTTRPYSELKNISSFKETFRTSLHQRFLKLFPDQDIGKFSSSLIIGTALPYKQKELFKSKGLSHLFSVSGWHFSLFANALFFLFGSLTPKRRCLLTLFLLSLLNLIFPTSPDRKSTRLNSSH